MISKVDIQSDLRKKLKFDFESKMYKLSIYRITPQVYQRFIQKYMLPCEVEDNIFELEEDVKKLFKHIKTLNNYGITAQYANTKECLIYRIYEANVYYLSELAMIASLIYMNRKRWLDGGLLIDSSQLPQEHAYHHTVEQFDPIARLVKLRADLVGTQRFTWQQVSNQKMWKCIEQNTFSGAFKIPDIFTIQGLFQQKIKYLNQGLTFIRKSSYRLAVKYICIQEKINQMNLNFQKMKIGQDPNHVFVPFDENNFFSRNKNPEMLKIISDDVAQRIEYLARYLRKGEIKTKPEVQVIQQKKIARKSAPVELIRRPPKKELSAEQIMKVLSRKPSDRKQ